MLGFLSANETHLFVRENTNWNIKTTEKLWKVIYQKISKILRGKLLAGKSGKSQLLNKNLWTTPKDFLPGG